MAKEFTEWLDSELAVREWTRAELARRAKINESSLSLIYSGGREPGPKVCDGIARAFKMPADIVYRMAGILPVKPSDDETVSEITHIYHNLNDVNKEDLLDYARMRLSKQEREEKKSGKRDRVA